MDDFVIAAWSMAEAAGSHLAGVSLPLLVAGLALHTLKLGARARAWQNVLRASFPERRVEFRDAAIPYFAGTGAGVLIPFGGGEVLRVALARTRLRSGDEHESASTATIVGSLAAERVLDVAVAFIVVALAVTAGLLPNGALHARLGSGVGAVESPLVAAGIAAIGLASAAGGYALRRRCRAAGARLLRGLAVLGQPSRYLSSVASWQLLSWVLRFAALVLFLKAFHVSGAIAVAPVVLSLQLLAASVPFTPGGAGTQQALLAAALGSAAIVGFSAGAQIATILVDVALGIGALAACGTRPSFDFLRGAAATNVAVRTPAPAVVRDP
jgi:uncharacterized membrane protein YbhN (UPF0104 family)